MKKISLTILFTGFFFLVNAYQEEPKNKNKRFSDTMFKDTMYKKGIDQGGPSKGDNKHLKNKSTRDTTKRKPK